MTSINKYLKNLYDQELYSNIVRVCDLTLTAAEQKTDAWSLPVKLQIMLYYADSLYKIQQYLQAENLYRQTLQIRKNIIKNKNANNKINDFSNDLTSDVEIKYKIHLCCLALKQRNAAIDILQVISARLRTPKINMALGNLFKEAGMERSAITCYKEVLRECPLALEAVENLLKLGIKGVEVNSLMVEVTSDITWLNSWLKAQAQLYSRDFANALQTYKSMDTHGLLKNNTSLLVNMGYCYHYLCDDEKAINVLQRAINLDPNLIFGRDLLSTILASSSNKEHIRYLENLIPSIDMSLWSSEHWVVLGNYMYATKKYDKAAYFGQEACLLNRRNVEAFLLKANSLLQVKTYPEAAMHCTEALQLCPYRYDLHKCLVDCYLQANRLREAESHALSACKQLNYSSQAYTVSMKLSPHIIKYVMLAAFNVIKLSKHLGAHRVRFQSKHATLNGLTLTIEKAIEQNNFTFAMLAGGLIPAVPVNIHKQKAACMGTWALGNIKHSHEVEIVTVASRS